jgi:N-methylhydantoinase B/oxoprolinase/acetone carboxylase alpha subunit
MPGGIDYEIVTRFHPEKPTAEELEYMRDIDPTKAGIFAHKLKTVAAEGNETLIKLGATTGCRWGDTALALYTVSGDNAMCATGLYFHAVLGSTGVKYVNRHWLNDPSVGVRPGDAFFCNDPFYLGVHGPDMGVFAPIFYRDRIVCWAGALVHSGENGSCEPGGMPSGSRSIYDEGLLVPPTKIAENYMLKEDIINLFNHMTRDPRAMTLDTKARMAALRVVERRLHAVIEKVGPEYVMAVLRYNIQVTADGTRRQIRQWNDGKFRHLQFLDSVGPLPRLMKVAVTLEKKDDALYLDFDGTSPEVRDRVVNAISLGIIGINMVYWMGHLFHDLPHNAGILEPIHFRFPQGSIVNASRESPKAGSPFTLETAAQTVQQLLQKAVFSTNPELGEATGARVFATFAYGGLNQHGAPIADISADTNACGFGARMDKDGVNVAGSYFAPMTSEPGEIESLESNLPFLYLYRGFNKDSCGNGKYRGGVGIEWAVAVHDVPMVYLGSWGYASRAIVTQGLYGGYGIPALPFVRVSKNNLKEMLDRTDNKLPSSNKALFEETAISGLYQSEGFPTVPRPMNQWDLIVGGHGGGGGYGDPIERDPASVMNDLENGVISPRVARDVYRVVYNEEKLIVDEEGTKASRDQEREDRKRRGKRYEEFEKEWLRKKPSAEVLEFYGEWPVKSYTSFTYYGSWGNKQEEK